MAGWLVFWVVLGSDIIASYLAVRALPQPTSDPENYACFTGIQSFRVLSVKGASPAAGRGLCALNEDAEGDYWLEEESDYHPPGSRKLRSCAASAAAAKRTNSVL